MMPSAAMSGTAMSATAVPPLGGASLTEIGGQDARVAPDQRGRPVGDLAAGFQHDHATTQRHDEVHVVLDDDQRHPFGIQPVKDRKSTRLNSSHVAISYAVF